MTPFLLEFIDSDFMKGVFYLGAFLLGLVALGSLVCLWRLTSAGVQRWKRIRSGPQPVPISSRLVAVLMVTPAVLVGLATIFGVILAIWFDQYQKQWRRKYEAEVRQHRAATRAGLLGHYTVANPMLLAVGHDTFADTIPPKPVHVDLFLRPDSTYSYRSTIATDVTRDTSGTWEMVDYQYDGRFNYEPFAIVFTPTTQPACGLSISREGSGPIYFRGAYYLNNGYTPFALRRVGTSD